jgi:PAS domain S-box-containing protein
MDEADLMQTESNDEFYENLCSVLEASMSIGIQEFNVLTWRVTCDARTAEFYGIDPEQARIGGVPINQIMQSIHPEDHQLIIDEFFNLYRDKREYSLEYRIVRRDRSIIWVLGRGRSITDDQGNLTRLIGILMDITERKQVEQALQASEERYKKLYRWEKIKRHCIQKLHTAQDTAQLLTWVCEELVHILEIDRCMILEVTPTGLRPVRFVALRDSGLCPFVKTTDPWQNCPFLKTAYHQTEVFITDTQSPENGIEATWRRILKDNGIRGYALIPMLSQGELLQIITLHHQSPRLWCEEEIDFLHFIAEQIATLLIKHKDQEHAETPTRKKDEFLAMISHELRTPLNIVIGYAKMMTKGHGGKLNERQEKYINNIYVSGINMLDIVNNMLDVAELEADISHSPDTVVNHQKSLIEN